MWVVPLQLTVQYWWKIKCNTNRIQNSVKGDLDGIDHLIKVKITLIKGRQIWNFDYRSL